MRISVEGLDLELRETQNGPILMGGTPLTDPLAWVVNSAFNNTIPSLADALRRGDNAGRGGIFMVRPLSEHGVAVERENWRRLSGRDPGNDVYLIGTDFLEHALLAPRSVLLGIVEALEKLRLGTPPAPLPSLFREDPVSQVPAEGEELLVGELEKRLQEFETLEKHAATPDERAELSAKRRFLLLDLQASGLLDDQHREAKSVWLHKWKFERLERCYQAVLRLIDYFASDVRREFIPSAGKEPVRGAEVSVDWFRFEQRPPAGIPPFQWLAFCEQVFRSGEVGEGGEGEVLTQVDEGWVRIKWRRDDGTTPTIVSAEIMDKPRDKHLVTNSH